MISTRLTTPRIIAVANQKGGVGKTTTCLNLGYSLVSLNKTVLLVDADPQGSLTIHCNHNPDTLDKTIYNCLIEDLPLKDVLIDLGDLHLIPANIDLSASEIELVSTMERERILADKLREVKGNYDYVLVDCPPSLGLLTINALVASNGVIIPMQTEYLAMRGVKVLFEIIAQIQKRPNRRLKIFGILPTMFDTRTLHSKEVLEETRKSLRGKVNVFNTVIHRSIRFSESPITGKGIKEYAPETKGASQYDDLAKELIKWLEKEQG